MFSFLFFYVFLGVYKKKTSDVLHILIVETFFSVDKEKQVRNGFWKFISNTKKKSESSSTSSPPPIVQTNDDNRYINLLKDCKPTELEDYGYYFFLERFGKEYTLTIPQRILQLSIPFDSASCDLARKIECEKYVMNSIESNPLIKTFVQTLNDYNCPIDLSRHFSCEYLIQ